MKLHKTVSGIHFRFGKRNRISMVFAFVQCTFSQITSNIHVKYWALTLLLSFILLNNAFVYSQLDSYTKLLSIQLKIWTYWSDGKRLIFVCLQKEDENLIEFFSSLSSKLGIWKSNGTEFISNWIGWNFSISPEKPDRRFLCSCDTVSVKC